MGVVNLTDGVTAISCVIAGNARVDGQDMSQLVPAVMITEVQSVNPFGPPVDENSVAQPWVELYNYGSIAVDISGWALTDDPRYPEKWTFPDSVVIEPDEYLIVFLSSLDRRPLAGNPALHTSFGLDTEGGTVILSGFKQVGGAASKQFSSAFAAGSVGYIQSYVVYPEMLQGTSYSFYGDGDVNDSNPTFVVTTTGGASPGAATPFEATGPVPMTWTIVPFRLFNLQLIQNVSVINPPDPIVDDQLLTGEIVAQWCAEATKNITQDDDRDDEIHFIDNPSPMGGGSAIAKGDDDCACTGVEISMKMYPDPNVNPGTVFLPTVSHFSDITGKAIRYPTDIKDDQIDLVVKSLWEKKFTTEYVGDTSTVFTLMAGAELMSSGEVNLGLRGYLDGGYPKNWNLVFMVNTPKWDWTTLTHELGHYVGIGGHWNGNEHPYRIIASEPHKMRSIDGWNPYWFKPAVTMTKEECAYWRGAWDRLSYDTRFFPEGRDDEHFSYYSESGKAYWDEWINKDDYPYLERPGSTGSP